MRMKFFGLAAAILIACTGSDTASANIVYQLDLGSNATGTITTDGTTGVLQTANIVDFNIALTVGSNTGTVTGPLSGGNYVQFGTSGGSSAFTATLTALFFDFSAVGGTPYLIFQSNDGYLCYNGAAGNCSGQPSALSVAANPSGFSATVFRGNQEIASAVIAGAVPEPATWAMMLLGFCGLGFLAYRRRRDGNASAAA
jgi:hypothetical protein